MSKKHKKNKHNQQAYNGYAQAQYGYPLISGASPQAGFDPNARMEDSQGFHSQHSSYGSAAGGSAMNRDIFRDMSSLFPSQHTDQFLMGLVIGTGAAWVLGDEEIRGKLIKAAMKVYAGVAGSVEEVKEQMADIRAEVAAERHGNE